MNTQLLEWYNLIFELPLGLGLMYLALYTFSGWTFGDADVDAGGFDHDVDAHLDVQGEFTVDQDADVSQEIHSDTDSHSADADANSTQAPLFLSALNWVGIGRMPMSLVLMILMILWGTLGFAAMEVQRDRPTDHSVWIAIAVAAAGSLFITHFVASLLGKTIFATLNIARRRHELLGSMGEAMYPIDDKFGMVCGRDDSGELFQVACRIEQGQESIAKGAAVQLVAYTAKERIFYVVPAETSSTPRRALNANV